MPNNEYDVVTVYGNKTSEPWDYDYIPRFIGRELRNCHFVGMTLRFTPGVPGIGCETRHMITAWGDYEGETLNTNPDSVRVTDSDDAARENGEDVQAYDYVPIMYGWALQYLTFSPYIVNVVTLSKPDTECGGSAVIAVGSYEITQDQAEAADGLEYTVGTDIRICTYKTELDHETTDRPQIVKYHRQTGHEYLTVEWEFGATETVSQGTIVTITTELLEPDWNGVCYRDVHFTYPSSGSAPKFPFRWEIVTPPGSGPGGFVVGAFDIYADPECQNLVGRYRLQHEYGEDQNPDCHYFRLYSLASVPYYVGPFLFGTSDTLLAPDALWDFSAWSQTVPDTLPTGLVLELELGDCAGQQTGVNDGVTGHGAAYYLGQNFPNPFNPATTIEYRLAHEGHVRLSIYDVAGRTVRVLVDDDKPAGGHRVTWDGRDYSGNPAASGVYFYRIQAGSFVEVKKLLFLK